MNSTDIAIIGMDCLFPRSRSLAEYFQVLVHGENCIQDVPTGRLNGRSVLPITISGQAVAMTKGGFLPADLRFDPLAYHVIPQIIPDGDPDQFLMLRVADRALRDGGVAAQDPIRERSDLIVGRGGYITNQMSELFLESDLSDRLVHLVAEQFPAIKDSELEDFAKKLKSSCQTDVDNISTCIPNLVASRTANRLNLRGAAFTVDAACASSLVAVDHGITRLQQQQSDLVIAGGMHLIQTPTFWSIFGSLGVLSPSQQIRPFDRKADGLLIGEGVGAVVLKRLEDAIENGDSIYAIIKGSGIANDGNQTAVLTPSSSGQVSAMNRAYEKAQLDPLTVGLVEAHGTGTVVGDEVEIESLKSIFGCTKELPTRALGSVKSMIGHTMPAAGIASLIKVALSLHHKCWFPSLNCDDQHEALQNSSLFVNRKTRPWIQDPRKGPRRAGVNAFGFGGVNCHLVLEEVPNVEGYRGSTLAKSFGNQADLVAPARAFQMPGLRDSELFLLSGNSSCEVLQQVLQLLQTADSLAGSCRSEHELRARFCDCSADCNRQVTFEVPFKLAIIATDFVQLESRLNAIVSLIEQDQGLADENLLEKDLRDKDLPEGIYLSTNAKEPIGKVAGIFPGLGFPGLVGNYPEHLLNLCLHYPEVRAEFDLVDARDDHPEDSVPSSLIFSPPDQQTEEVETHLKDRLAPITVAVPGVPKPTLPQDRNFAAAGITISNWVSWRLLEGLEIDLDMACGQSQGEMAAMCAAQMIDFEEIVPRFWVDRAEDYAGKGCLAFMACDEEKFRQHTQDLPDVSIAIHVAPEMLIAGGPTDQLERLIRRLKPHCIANLLPYPPIHTPRLSQMRARISEEIQQRLHFKPAENFQVYSSITQKPFPQEQDQIWELMLANLDSPVRFWQSIHQMYDDGARVFVQVGGGSMAANIKSVLPRPDLVATALDVEHRPPLTQLQHLCGTLFTNGIRFNPEFLHRYSGARELKTAAEPASSTLELPLRMDWIPFTSGSTPVKTDARPRSVADEPSGTNGPGVETADAEKMVPSAADKRFPFIGSLEWSEDRNEVVNQMRLDLREHPFLQDHAVVDTESGKAAEHRLAVLPVTMCMEMMCETAALMAGPLDLLGFEQVRAMRWIDFPDTLTQDLQIQARVVAEQAGNPPDNADSSRRPLKVEVEVGWIDPEEKSEGDQDCVSDEIHVTQMASAVVLFGASNQEAEVVEVETLINQREWPIEAQGCYAERHLFHGPRFQCISELQSLADDGLWASIKLLSQDDLFASLTSPQLLTDPVANDGFLQLAGMWAIAHGFYVLPSRIDSLRFHGPAPPTNSLVRVFLKVDRVDLEQRAFAAHLRVYDENHGLWLSIDGLHEWVFDYATEFQDTQRQPRYFHVAQPIFDDGMMCVELKRESFRSANLDWVARLYLHQEEYLMFQTMPNPKRKWEWLLGRIAVKDAVRLWDRRNRNSQEMEHPAKIMIEQDAHGRPFVGHAINGTSAPEISLSHSEGFAIAVACEDSCGIDIEPLNRNTIQLQEQFTTELERQLLGVGDETRYTALWCAKEAAAKKAGTGLQGRPKDFELVEVRGSEMVIKNRRQDSVTAVHVFPSNGFWVATTLAGQRQPES